MQGMRQRLSTLEEDEEEGDADGGTAQGRHQSSEQQQADECAAELLRTNSLITLGALDAGKKSPLTAPAAAWLYTRLCDHLADMKHGSNTLFDTVTKSQ